jgi:tetratricopeptide (TPR) repeat protein
LAHRRYALLLIEIFEKQNSGDNYKLNKNVGQVANCQLASLKHVNLALTYLKYLKDLQIEITDINISLNDDKRSLVRQRQASIYYLIAKCHLQLGNNETSLEMFASSLDLYEEFNKELNITILQDRVLSVKHLRHLNGETLMNSLRTNDPTMILHSKQSNDTESHVVYMKRIDLLYQYITDILIGMNKLNEALLVAERHRTKLTLLQKYKKRDEEDQVESVKFMPESSSDLVNFDDLSQLLSSRN